jgi:hypothetical protein
LDDSFDGSQCARKFLPQFKDGVVESVPRISLEQQEIIQAEARFIGALLRAGFPGVKQREGLQMFFWQRREDRSQELHGGLSWDVRVWHTC